MGSVRAIRSTPEPLLMEAGASRGGKLYLWRKPASPCFAERFPPLSGTTPYTALDSVRGWKSHLSDSLTNLHHCRICSYFTYLLLVNILYGQPTYRSWHCCNRQLSRSQMKAYATLVYNQFTFLQHFLKITFELNPFFIDLNCSSRRSVCHVSIVSVNAQQCFYTMFHGPAKIISVNKII